MNVRTLWFGLIVCAIVATTARAADEIHFLRALNMNSNSIVRVGAPNDGMDVANKNYVDATSNALVNLPSMIMPGGEQAVLVDSSIALGYNSGVRSNSAEGSANIGWNSGTNSAAGEGSMNLGLNDEGYNAAMAPGSFNIGVNASGRNIADGWGSMNMGLNLAGYNYATHGALNAGLNWEGINMAADWGSMNMGYNDHATNLANASGTMNLGYNAGGANIATLPGALNAGVNLHGHNIAKEWAAMNIGMVQEGINSNNAYASMNLGYNYKGLNLIEYNDRIAANINAGYNYIATNIMTLRASGALNMGVVMLGGINIADYSAAMNIGQNEGGSNNASHSSAMNIGRNKYGVNVASAQAAMNIGFNESAVNKATGQGSMTIGYNNAGYRHVAAPGALIGGATAPGGSNIVIAAATGAWAVGHGVIVSHQYAYVFGTNLYSLRENSLVCQNLDVFGTISVGAAPVSAQDAATKAYVDDRANLSVYWFCTKTPNVTWKNNTDADDWNWEDYVVPLNGADHRSSGIVQIKLRIYGNSDDGSTMYVGVRNHTDNTYAITPAVTGLPHGGGWWETGWVEATLTSLKELRLSAYTSNSSKYYYIKRAMLLVR